MDYHIEVKSSSGEWSRIASFENIMDRDDCLAFLASKYDDVDFRPMGE